MHQRFVVQALALCAGLSGVAMSQASITVYTSEASFLAVVTAPAVDTFDNPSPGGIPASPLSRSIGTYSYKATEGPFYPYFNTLPLGANKWLPAGDTRDTVTFASLVGAPQGIGGNFFEVRYNNIVGTPTAGTVKVIVVDSLGAMTTQTVADATQSTFLGFVSDGTITSLAMSSINNLNVAVDNLTFASMPAIPEPGTTALLLAGLGSIGVMVRRRRQGAR